jgi:hypothetical protein
MSNPKKWGDGGFYFLCTPCRRHTIFPLFRVGSMCPSIDEISQIILGYRYEFRMNLKTNQVTQKQLSLLAIECPKINEEYTGR